MAPFKESLTDLELAQRGMPDNAALHAGLAEVYKRLEMPELAEAHRKKSSPEKGNGPADKLPKK